MGPKILVSWETPDNKEGAIIEEINRGLSTYNMLYSDEYSRVKSSQPDYILKVRKTAQLSCISSELVEILRQSVTIGGFDKLLLDNFKSIAMLYKVQPEGLPTYIILPEPFAKKLLKAKSSIPSVSYGSRVKDIISDDYDTDNDYIDRNNNNDNNNLNVNLRNNDVNLRNNDVNLRNNSCDDSNKQLVVYNEDGGHRGILLAAFAFFVVLILAGLIVFCRGRRSRG